MKKLVLLSVFSVAPLFAVSCPTGYSNSFALTVPAQTSLSSDLTNYAAPFIGNAALAATGSGGLSQSSGTDVVFCTAATSGTLIPFELVAGTYNSATGAGVWWIQNPTVSHTVAQSIYMLVGKASATDQSCGPSGTNNCGSTLWNGYLQVHHFGTSGSLTLTDSTGLCTATNHGATAVAGPINGAANFVAANSQYIDTGCISNPTSNLTFKTLVKPTSFILNQRIISNLTSPTYNGYEIVLGTSGANGTTVCQTGNGGTISNNNSNFFTTSSGVWTLLACKASVGTTIRGYQGGVYQGTGTTTIGAIGNSTLNFNIGRWPGTASNFFDGAVAEVQVVNSAQSDDLIKADNASWLSPGTFYTVSALASTYSITGAAIILTGTARTYTVTPDNPYTGTITLSDGASGGTFTPTSLTFSSSTPQTFTYANATPGSYVLTGSSSPSLSNGTLSITVRAAASFYISASGSDSNAGTSTGAPWQTISKVNGSTFLPGDSILFNGGDTFTGTIALALIGTQTAPITIGSYGTGQGIIHAYGSGCGTPAVVDGIALTDSEYVVINNLNLVGCGWTGTLPSITVINGGKGIDLIVTRTSGTALRNISIKNNTITGFWHGIYGTTIASASLVGFQNLSISRNTITGDLGGGILIQGFHPDAGGAVNTHNNIYIGYNTITNIPGDPVSGTGGVHGSVLTEAWAIDLNNMTGVLVEHNYMANIAGYGGLTSGLTLGGSSAFQIGNARNVTVVYNETYNTQCSNHYDGSAIDLDQDTQNAVVAYNLSYGNMGPAVQVGSFGGKTTGTVYVHHNVSYNDVRGNGNNGTAEQGAIRLWGGNAGVWIYNNSIYVNSTGTIGIPSAINWEISPSTGVVIANNLFKVTGGISILHGNTTFSAQHIGSPVVVNNVYDASGGSLVISNDTGASTTNVTSLAAWQTAGYETFLGNTYGTVSTLGLPNISAFSAPANGFIAAGWASIPGFNPGTPAIGAGIDPWMVGADLGPADFFGSPSRQGAAVDVGAVSSVQAPNRLQISVQ